MMGQDLIDDDFSEGGVNVDIPLRNAYNEGVKSNKCNQCNYVSFWAGDLRTHLKMHSGEKPNKCDQCDCASSQAGSLMRHLKTHSGENPNKCNQCDFAPSYASALRTHFKTHSGGCRRFEEAENTQWRKVKQMQPVLLCIISCRQFKETLKNVWTHYGGEKECN